MDSFKTTLWLDAHDTICDQSFSEFSRMDEKNGQHFPRLRNDRKTHKMLSWRCRILLNSTIGLSSLEAI